MKRLWLVIFTLCTAHVNALDDFMPIELVGNYQDFGVHLKSNNISNLAMIELENVSNHLLNCEGVFHSGPEPDVIRRVVLQPGTEKVISAKFFRHVIKLKVTVNCDKA